MERTPVNSSSIASVGHDPETNTLEVEYKNGSVYHYHDVPAEKHEALIGAESVGSHFAAHIRNAHEYTKQS
jgi:hypothetical protein